MRYVICRFRTSCMYLNDTTHHASLHYTGWDIVICTTHCKLHLSMRHSMLMRDIRETFTHPHYKWGTYPHDKLEVLCIARQANYSYLHDTQQNWCYLSRANNCLPNIHTHSHEVHVVCFVCYSCSPSILHTATNKKHLRKKRSSSNFIHLDAFSHSHILHIIWPS